MAGQVFVWLGSPFGPNGGVAGTESNAHWSVTSNTPGQDRFGVQIAGAGDVDGDGVPDLAVAATHRIAGSFNQAGAVFGFDGAQIASGGDVGLAGNSPWGVQGNSELEWLGSGLAGAGDLNGDGYADLAVGSLKRGANGELGEVQVFQGAPTGLLLNRPWIRTAQSRAGNGLAVASAGDFNGDGYDDFLMGSPYVSNAKDEEGRVELFLGSPADPSALCVTPHFFAHGGTAGVWLGRAVLGADVDGDGCDDLVAAAPHDSSGEVRVWKGRRGTWLFAAPDTVFAGDTLTYSAFGGKPGARLVLFVAAVNGTPLIRPLFTVFLDGDSTWSQGYTVPAGLAGLVIDHFAVTLNCRGKAVLTSSVTVTFH